MKNTVGLYLFAIISMLVAFNVIAKELDHFADGFAMSVSRDQKLEAFAFQFWSLSCLKLDQVERGHCTLNINEFYCSPKLFQTVTLHGLSSDNKTFEIIGGWLADGKLSARLKDGTFDFACKFDVKRADKISGATCSSNQLGQTVKFEMPKSGIHLNQRCKDVFFHGQTD